ncbi:MAG: prepilin-type N-terminal cleavage/methylation domain-containing protein [Myxococcota bacterium]
MTPAPQPRLRPFRARVAGAGRRGRSRAGMTLIEILIVITLLAGVMAGVSYGVGAIHRTKLKSACTRVVAGARFAFHRSVTKGRTVRLAFDLDEGTLALEEADGEVTIDRSEDRNIDPDEDTAAVDPWAMAQARIEETVVVQANRSAFGPIVDGEGDPIRRYRPRALDGVRIVQIQTPHEPEPRIEGKGFIYFFPGGRAEHATVQLADRNDHVFTVEIHALTGAGKIHNYAYEPVDLEDEGDEVRDSR